MSKKPKIGPSNKTLEETLERMAKEGLIVPRTENNPYLRVSYKGANGLISSKWNIKIYTSGSVVCIDPSIIREFYHNRLKSPDKNLKLIQIDDAGIGFPLGGCMVGACCDGRVVTDVVDVAFFKPGPFERQDYLNEYAHKGNDLIIKEFNATSKTHRIEICTGHVNSTLRELLKSQGYDVRLVDIKGLLQDQLENLFKDYIKELIGKDLAYDPKELTGYQIAKNYEATLQWGMKNVPHLLKTGWGKIREKL